VAEGKSGFEFDAKCLQHNDKGDILCPVCGSHETVRVVDTVQRHCRARGENKLVILRATSEVLHTELRCLHEGCEDLRWWVPDVEVEWV
jgi:hypothetical protein